MEGLHRLTEKIISSSFDGVDESYAKIESASDRALIIGICAERSNDRYGFVEIFGRSDATEFAAPVGFLMDVNLVTGEKLKAASEQAEKLLTKLQDNTCLPLWLSADMNKFIRSVLDVAGPMYSLQPIQILPDQSLMVRVSGRNGMAPLKLFFKILESWKVPT